jgi:hypothetical protein
MVLEISLLIPEKAVSTFAGGGSYQLEPAG